MSERNVRRRLTTVERTLLQLLLAHDFDGAQALREQVIDAQVIRGCQCGCGTIAFVIAGSEHVTPSNPAPVEGQVLSAEGEPIGGLLLFVGDGQLVSFEVYSYGPEPLEMPNPEHVTWVTR